MGSEPDDEEEQLRSVAIQNARSILLARQRAERELFEAKEALEARTAELERANIIILTIAENATSGLIMLDERGVATYVNPAAMEQTGYSSEEFLRTSFHELLHAPAACGSRASSRCLINDARERMEPLKNHRDVFVRKDGSSIPVSCSLSPLQRDGEPAGAVLEFRDITDEHLAQKALEEASHRKDEFLATLSHELRTPMTAVLGWARMLKMGLGDMEARTAVNAIEKSAEIQAQLIDDVLDVSRIMAGKMTFQPTAVNPGTVLQAALTTVHPAVAAKGIEILSSIPPSLPNILGDEGRLQQIIWNLLSNAVKFTPRGGSITVRIGPVGSLLRLTVSDSGKGIEPAYLPHVFEPFSQEDGSMSRSHEGIGLGLSIVRSLVELHGGRVRVASEGSGRGATFTVDLPILESAPAVESDGTKGAPSKVAPQESQELPDLRGVKVLVIDDQEFTRELVSTIFRRANAEVHAASSVREGLNLFEAVIPDVVVSDLAMPVEDGYVFVKAVRALSDADRSRTPIIALTAFGRPEDRRRALASGFDDYLKKPADPHELASTVLRFTRRNAQ